jgi:hypothetical protein
MSTRFFVWYTCVVLALVLLMLSAITVGPEGENFVGALGVVVGVGLVILVVFGIKLQSLPREHWVNQSRIVNVIFALLAFFASFLLLMG